MKPRSGGKISASPHTVGEQKSLVTLHNQIVAVSMLIHSMCRGQGSGWAYLLKHMIYRPISAVRHLSTVFIILALGVLHTPLIPAQMGCRGSWIIEFKATELGTCYCGQG